MNTPIIPASKKSIKNVKSLTFFVIFFQVDSKVSGVRKVVNITSNNEISVNSYMVTYIYTLNPCEFVNELKSG